VTIRARTGVLNMRYARRKSRRVREHLSHTLGALARDRNYPSATSRLSWLRFAATKSEPRTTEGLKRFLGLGHAPPVSPTVVEEKMALARTQRERRHPRLSIEQQSPDISTLV
jgi:hypothetical protein